MDLSPSRDTLPMTLCNNPREWHAWVEKLITANDFGPAVDPEAELRTHVAQRLGPRALDTHDWFYTPGSGAMIDQLLGRLPIEERGAVLPTYQRVAAALADADTSVAIEPPNWSDAAFLAPRRPPTVLFVNPLHANPTGATLPTAFLAAVADYAASTGALLVEDDPFRGLDPDDDRWPTLLSLYPERTVYLGSWTKVLGWPAKLGFAGWPRGLRARPAVRNGTGPLGPAGLAGLLRTGGVEQISVRRRTVLTRRRDELTAMLRAFDVRFIPPTGGAHLAALIGDADDLHRQLAYARVGGLAARDFFPPRATVPPEPFVRLGLSDAGDGDWPDVLRRLERVLSIVSRQ